MEWLRKNLFSVFLGVCLIVLTSLDIITTYQGLEYEQNDLVVELVDVKLFILIKYLLCGVIFLGLLVSDKTDFKIRFLLRAMTVALIIILLYVVSNNYYVLSL